MSTPLPKMSGRSDATFMNFVHEEISSYKRTDLKGS